MHTSAHSDISMYSTNRTIQAFRVWSTKLALSWYVSRAIHLHNESQFLLSASLWITPFFCLKCVIMKICTDIMNVIFQLQIETDAKRTKCVSFSFSFWMLLHFWSIYINTFLLLYFLFLSEIIKIVVFSQEPYYCNMRLSLIRFCYIWSRHILGLCYIASKIYLII